MMKLQIKSILNLHYVDIQCLEVGHV